jgi:O-antigen/teichoic acid export membrane protein
LQSSTQTERSAAVGSLMLKGAAWMTTFRVVDRCAAIFSTAVLARLLMPEDFGLIALAASMIALLEILGAFGFEIALIQRADISRKHFDSVWSFNLLFALALAGLIGLLARPISFYYGDDRLAYVLVFLGLRHAILGFENIGVVTFRKELAFDKEFKFLLIKRLTATFLVTIPLAFLLRSYWALLAGSLTGACIGVGMSFVLHPFRPRFSFSGLRELMNFSRWLLLGSFVEFLYARAANFMVGAWAGAGALGSLSMAQEIAGAASHELAAPVNRAMLPGYAKLEGDRAVLREKFVKATSILLFFIVPAATGLSLLAEPMVLLLLGKKWNETIPLIQVLAIDGVLTVFLSTSYHLNLAVGMSRSTSIVLACHAVITITMMLWIVPGLGSYGAAIAILTGSIVTAPLNFLLLRRAIRFGAREILDLIWCPVTSTLAMILVVMSIKLHWDTPTTVAGLMGFIATLAGIGAPVYFACAFLLSRWRASPDSAETWIWQRATLILQGGLGRMRPARRQTS